ncbi:MAG: YqgE/AlgH family protein [Muribaculaceae bacterium]|nr:YqgE/AlgH family protein [Muribaculaceae bacterium]
MRTFQTHLFDLPPVKALPASGELLVSSPFLEEAYFNHAVIMMVNTPEDNEDGTYMGLVTNLSTNLTLDGIIDLPESVAEQSIPVYCGGPLSMDHLYFIHNLGPDILGKTTSLNNGLYIGADYDTLLTYLESGYPVEGHLRFFLGYTGWGASQLPHELAQGTWALSSAPSDCSELLTLSGMKAWQAAIHRLPVKYRAFKLVPANLSSN